MLNTRCFLSGESLQRFRYLNLTNIRKSSDDSNQVIKDIASKIIETNPDKSPAPVAKVDSETYKEIAAKIITKRDDILVKKFDPDDDPKQIAEKIMTTHPEVPTTCCMSGCANCVWLDYADKLAKYYEKGGEKAIEEMQKHVTDESLKAFLLHELRMRNKT